MTARRILLEPSPYEADGGELIGRDPRAITAGEWTASGLPRIVGLRAIRAKCLNCAGNAAEVRKCVAISCPLWPLRMGKLPKGLRVGKSASADQEASESGFRSGAGP